jgi:hypothetical protein
VNNRSEDITTPFMIREDYADQNERVQLNVKVLRYSGHSNGSTTGLTMHSIAMEVMIRVNEALATFSPTCR